MIGILGELKIVGAEAKERITIAVATSLCTMEGKESYQAVSLALEQINSTGGIQIGNQSFLLRLLKLDLDEVARNASIPQCLDRLERFITDQKIFSIIVGPYRSEVLLPAMKIFARHQTILIETIAMSSAMEAAILKSADNRYVFRTALNTKYLADTLIQFMKQLKKRFNFKRIFIVTQDVAWARSTTALMIRLYFDRKGWQLVGTDQLPEGNTNFGPTLAKAKKANAQVIFPIFDMPESIHLVKQWRKAKVPAIMCGYISSVTGKNAWPKTNGDIAGSLNVMFELGNIPSKHFQPATKFYNAYLGRYGRTIQSGHGPAPAYEAVYLLAKALEKAACLTPLKVVSALENSDSLGAMGRLRFNRGHQIIFGSDPFKEAVACLFQWTHKGRRRIVYPPLLAEGNIQEIRRSE